MDYASFGYGVILMGLVTIAIGRVIDNGKEYKLDKYVMQGRCDALVIAMIGAELTDGWWNSPNKAFNGQKPIDVELEVVYSYLMGYASR